MSSSASVTVRQISQNIVNNTSVVRVRVTASWTYGTYQASGVTVNFKVTSGSGTAQNASQSSGLNTGRSTSGSQYWERDFTIQHKNDGTQSVTAEGSFVYWDGTRYNKQSIGLTTIPRATTPTVAQSSVSYGGTISISLPRKATAFVHDVQVYGGKMSGWTTIASKVATSCTFTVPVDYAKFFTTTGDKLQVRAVTYNGTTVIGTQTASTTVALLPTAEMVPSIDAVSIEEAITAVTTAFGNKFVQGLSALAIRITASGIYGSTIAAYETEVNGVKYSAQAFNTNVLTESGSLTVKCKITDSRGIFATTEQTVTVQPYQMPTMANIDYQMCNSDGSANPDGTYMKVSVVGKAYPVDGANAKSIRLKYRAASESAYGTVALTSADWDFVVTTILSGMDATQTYVLTAELEDKWSSDSRTESTGVPVISRHAGGDGVSFGMEAKEAGFVSKYDAKFLGRVYVSGMDLLDYVYPVGSVYMSFNSANPAELFGGTWEQIKDRFLLSAGDTYKKGATGGEATHTLTVGEMPSHTHGQYVAIADSAQAKYMYADSNTSGGVKARSVLQNLSTSNQGGGGAHNNMPPYLAVYMWRRTA